MKYNSQNSIIILVVCFLALVAIPVVAAELYFGAQGQELSLEKNFEVGVLLNSEEESINAIEGKITFPTDSLDFQETREGASLINFWIKKPTFNGSGVSFSGIVPGGYSGSQGYLFSIILKPKKLGQVTIDGKEVRALRNEPPGAAAQMKISPMKLEIVEESQTPEFLPPYDTEAPESFTPQVARNPNIFDGKWFLVFNTQDKGAGIDHYEVKEKREFKILNFGFSTGEWVQTESPYLLKDQSLKSEISVKAIDKAGNERVATLPSQSLPHWYENYLIWAIIIMVGVVGYTIWRILWRKFHIKK